MNTRLRLGKRYELVERIGSGGMGIVYRAKDRLLDIAVALKSLRFDVYAESSFQGMSQRVQLANEFKWLASLRHPNIVSVMDYGFDLIAQPFFTMELLEGYENIVDACRNKPLSVRLEILGQVLHALAYLHRREVIHRDLKNSNVLVKDGQVKLLDFGLVATRGQATDENVVVGTLPYMSPETLMGDVPDICSDLYSFGVLAFYTLTGRLPFHNQDNRKLTHDILNTPVDFSDCSLPGDLQLVLGRLLDKSSDARYASANDVILALNEAGAAIPVETRELRECYLKAASFVGRDEELETLKTALMEVGERRGSACFISGERGIGKTRLVQELRTYALTRGYMIFESEGHYHQQLPYSLWHNVLRRLRLELDMDEDEEALIESILDGSVASLEESLPQLSNFLVTHLLSQDSVLVVLEDIHCADEPSLILLQQFLNIIPHLPVMLIATYRSDESPELGELLGATDELKLGRFRAKDVQNITSAMLGYTDENLVNLLMQETQGNLSYLVEALRSLAEEAGTLAEIQQIDLPHYQMPYRTMDNHSYSATQY